jgi:hypothetical protein
VLVLGAVTQTYVFLPRSPSLVRFRIFLPIGVKKPGSEINVNILDDTSGFLTVAARGGGRPEPAPVG